MVISHSPVSVFDSSIRSDAVTLTISFYLHAGPLSVHDGRVAVMRNTPILNLKTFENETIEIYAAGDNPIMAILVAAADRHVSIGVP
jgi:hypothetical protein